MSHSSHSTSFLELPQPTGDAVASLCSVKLLFVITVFCPGGYPLERVLLPLQLEDVSQVCLSLANLLFCAVRKSLLDHWFSYWGNMASYPQGTLGKI